MAHPVNGGLSLPVEPTGSTTRRSTSPAADQISRWSSWTILLLERIPLPYALIVLLAASLVGGEQLFEFMLEVGTLPNSVANTVAKLARYLVLPILTAYMLLMIKRLKTSAVRSLAELRPAVQIDDSEYDSHVYHMVNANWRVEFALLLVSAAGVFILNNQIGFPLELTTSVRASQFGPLAFLIQSPYVIFGWVFLNLVFSALQLGHALGRLAHRPLTVDIYDIGNLLPFGHIALVYCLSIAGVILILLIGLGQPTQLTSWVVIALLSVASFVALVIPLWGVNQQLRAERNAELERIHAQLRLVRDRIVNHADLATDELAQMSNRTNTLVNLRKVVLETPTWPYRDTLTIVRALTIAVAPLLYFILTQIIARLLSP